MSEGFFVSSLGSKEVQILQKKIITNSEDVKVGLAVLMNVDDETVEAVLATVAVYGIIIGFEKYNGACPPLNDGDGGDFYLDYTAASDNETVEKMCALIDVSTSTKYSVDVDATLGTTGNSDQAGNMFDVVAASDELDESSVSASEGQFLSWGVDPENSSRLIVTINESQLAI